MRGFEYHFNKLFEYRIHQSLEMVTKDVRIAMTETNDDYDKFRLLLRVSRIIAPRIMNDILGIICKKPDDIVFSDVVMSMFIVYCCLSLLC
jgi:hypothetical protein